MVLGYAERCHAYGIAGATTTNGKAYEAYCEGQPQIRVWSIDEPPRHARDNSTKDMTQARVY
jgi:hypothetical protein